jgi:Na+/H+ antiporter NhaA
MESESIEHEFLRKLSGRIAVGDSAIPRLVDRSGFEAAVHASIAALAIPSSLRKSLLAALPRYADALWIAYVIVQLYNRVKQYQ